MFLFAWYLPPVFCDELLLLFFISAHALFTSLLTDTVLTHPPCILNAAYFLLEAFNDNAV